MTSNEQLEQREASRQLGPWRFTAMLPAHPSPDGTSYGFDTDVLSGFEWEIVRWIVEHSAMSKETLRMLRQKGRLARAELAQLLQVDADLVKRWESGAETFSVATWVVVAALCLEVLDGGTAIRGQLAAARTPPAGGAVALEVKP